MKFYLKKKMKQNKATTKTGETESWRGNEAQWTLQSAEGEQGSGSSTCIYWWVIQLLDASISSKMTILPFSGGLGSQCGMNKHRAMMIWEAQAKEKALN